MTETPMGKAISKANEELGNRIGSLLIHAYGDGKKLTLSAHSFPMRVLVSRKSQSFNFNDKSKEAKLDEDLQYVTPNSHLELLKCIVDADRDSISKKIEESVAISLRCDGSVDRTQIDKIFVMAKLVLRNGETDTLFLGAAEPQSKGAKGIYDAVQTACNNTVGEHTTKYILKNMSSIVTDGANINIGEKNGLWSFIDSVDSEIPKLKIWCAVHRTQLAWKSVTDVVHEVTHLLEKLGGLSTFFHISGVRTRELKEVARENELALLSLPKVFEVRWTEYTFSLVNSVLQSWHALVLYMQKSKDSQAKGFKTLLTNKTNLQLIAFVADVLAVFSRFQKKLQSDNTTLLNMKRELMLVKNTLSSLQETPLLGGWVSSLRGQTQRVETDEIDEFEPLYTLKGISLTSDKPRRRRGHHLFVTDRRDLSAIENEVVEALKEFLTQRFNSDDQDVLDILVPFLKFESDANVEAVVRLLCPDLDAMAFGLEYNDIVESAQSGLFSNLTLMGITKYLLAADGNFDNLATACARILAAKPHSADVERLISSSNVLKSVGRSCMSVDTENLYLYIHYNMPAINTWDPRPAILNWLELKDRRTRARDST